MTTDVVENEARSLTDRGRIKQKCLLKGEGGPQSDRVKTEKRGRRWMNAKKDWSGWQTDDKGLK